MANSYGDYTEYDKRESKLIEDWLAQHGYTWWQPTLCGSCCGMFDGYYRVDGIGGDWKSEADKKAFIEYANSNNIPYNKEEIEYASINPNVG